MKIVVRCSQPSWCLVFIIWRVLSPHKETLWWRLHLGFSKEAVWNFYQGTRQAAQMVPALPNKKFTEGFAV